MILKMMVTSVKPLKKEGEIVMEEIGFYGKHPTCQMLLRITNPQDFGSFPLHGEFIADLTKCK